MFFSSLRIQEPKILAVSQEVCTFIWIKTENVPNTVHIETSCSGKDNNSRTKEDGESEETTWNLRVALILLMLSHSLFLCSVNSYGTVGGGTRMTWQYFGLSAEQQTLHQDCGVCCVLEIA